MKPFKMDADQCNLDLSNHEVSDDDIRDIVIPSVLHYTHIRKLDLSNNYVGWRGARLLAENLTMLLSLDLSNNSVGDYGALFLSRNWSIQHLDLQNNNITPQGYNAFLINPALMYLDLSNQKTCLCDNSRFLILERSKGFPNLGEFSAVRYAALTSAFQTRPIKSSADVGSAQDFSHALLSPMQLTFATIVQEDDFVLDGKEEKAQHEEHSEQEATIERSPNSIYGLKRVNAFNRRVPIPRHLIESPKVFEAINHSMVEQAGALNIKSKNAFKKQ